MTKHTAGPWAFAKYSAKRFGLGQRGEGAFFFLQCVYGSADDPQARADARLIAAAPDLLEALRDFSDYVHAEQSATDGAVQYSNTQIHRLVFKARAAIAKASVESNNKSHLHSAKHSADSADSFCQQELYNLQSVAGRMALELECLLLDTKDLAVVSRWWDTGMEALQAYRDHIWSVTHGKDGESND